MGDEIETADGRVLHGELHPDDATYAWDAQAVEAWARELAREAGEPGVRAGGRVIAAVRHLESSGPGALARATALSS